MGYLSDSIAISRDMGPLSCMGERQSIAQKGVFALLTPEIHSYEMAQMLQKTSVRAPGLSANEREHPFV